MCPAATTVRLFLIITPPVPRLTLLPGGAALSCVADSNLTCNNVSERNRNLCRANAGNGGLFDGANIIQNLGQAKVN